MTGKDYIKEKGFSLLEVMVAIAVFTFVVTAAAGTFVSMQQAWRTQKASINLVQNIRWAMEFMVNQVRHSTTTLNPPQYPAWARVQIQVAGQRLQFGIDADGDGIVDTQIQFQRQGTVFQMRQRPNGVGPWGAWQELANFIVFPNPSGNAIFIDAGGGLYTIELTVRPQPAQPVGRDNRDYSVRSQVRPRN